MTLCIINAVTVPFFNMLCYTRQHCRLSRPRHCSKGAQPVPKVSYPSDCRDKHDRPRWDSNLGPLAPQSGGLPLSYRDLRYMHNIQEIKRQRACNMTEYHDSASESMVRCGIAPEGWILLSSSDKSWDFRLPCITLSHLGHRMVTSLKISIASQVSDGRHSLVVAVAVTVKLLLMFMQVRSFCLLDDSF